jgi:hypothetical protein
MKIAISQMTALAMLDATPELSPAICEQIRTAPPRADQLYLDVQPSDLCRALEGIRSFMTSGAEFNREAYKIIESELASLVASTA